MAKARWSTIYTLTETHPGSEGTRGAIDLPIAREAATGLPFLPDTSLKGVARAALRNDDDDRLTRLFGSDLPAQEDGADASTTPGNLSVLQGSLLLYPLRSLQRMFVYATSPLLLERLDRLARAVEIDPPWGKESLSELLPDPPRGAKALVADPELGKGRLYVERIAVQAQQDDRVRALGLALTGWLPEDERALRGRVEWDLVVLSDEVFAQLLEVAPPVRARIKLNERGTTDEDGNLWYEERLPADTLFWSFLVPRGGKDAVTDHDLLALKRAVRVVQIGGGATTGHGQCLWHVGG